MWQAFEREWEGNLGLIGTLSLDKREEPPKPPERSLGPGSALGGQKNWQAKPAWPVVWGGETVDLSTSSAITRLALLADIFPI